MIYDETSDFADKRKYVADLIEMVGLAGIQNLPNWRSLEIGGEGGLLAGLVADRVQHVISTDIVACQGSYEGRFLAELANKFDRQGAILPLDKVEFLTADAQNLPFRDDWFDFCFSQNAFEHIPDPEMALREAFRVTKVGGYIYIQFDPFWTADSGSHFLQYLHEPWLHLLATDDEIATLMRTNGASDMEIDSYRNHMNRLPVSYYREMFPRVIDELGGTVIYHHHWSGCVDPAFLDSPNLAAAAEKMQVDRDDLLVRGFRYLIAV